MRILAMILAANIPLMVNLAHFRKRLQDIIHAFGYQYSSTLSFWHGTGTFLAP
jgi:hypothetical protein